MVRQSREFARFAACLACVSSIAVACAGCAMTISRTSATVSQATRTAAGVTPGSWDRVQQLPFGAFLSVELKNGLEFRGRYSALRPGDLILTDRAGKPMTIAQSQISRVSVLSGDSLLNGATIGGGIGLAAAAIILTAAGSGDGYVLPSAKWGAPLVLSGAGVLAGVLVDRRRQRRELVYIIP